MYVYNSNKITRYMIIAFKYFARLTISDMALVKYRKK